MKMMKSVIFLLLGLLLGTGVINPEALATDESASAEQTGPATLKGERYQPSVNAAAELDAILDKARAGNKLALVIFGANWCHDSRALAARVFTEPLRTAVEENYETLFVDVGYLEKGRDVITRLGVPVYYATPTVLIVEPVSKQVINAQNRHQWANAANIGMEESLNYFQQFADTDLAAFRNTAETDALLQTLLAEILVFEQAQADRLYRAYTVLGPMLRAYKEGDKAAFSDELWNEVRDYRYRVPVDLEALRKEARRRTAAGETDIKLTYPVYPEFSWVGG